MTTSDESRARPEFSERAKRFFAQYDEPNGDIADILDASAYEAALSADPTLAIRSRLNVRLRSTTDEGVPGWVPERVQERVAAPLCRQFAVALDRPQESLELGLVGVSEGSVILHFEPRAKAEHEDGRLISLSSLDLAVEKIAQLNSLLEEEAPLGEIAAKFGTARKLLKATRAVMDGLDQCDLDMGVTWYGSSGSVRTSEVTSRARGHARSMFRRLEREQPATVDGYIGAVDLSGSIALVDALPAGRHRKTVKVAPEEMGRFMRRVGEWVVLSVEEKNEVDSVGLRSKTSWHFISETPTDQPLFEE